MFNNGKRYGSRFFFTKRNEKREYFENDRVRYGHAKRKNSISLLCFIVNIGKNFIFKCAGIMTNEELNNVPIGKSIFI